MKEYKVGDRVRVINADQNDKEKGICDNDTGLVQHGGLIPLILFDKKNLLTYIRHGQIELIEDPQVADGRITAEEASKNIAEAVQASQVESKNTTRYVTIPYAETEMSEAEQEEADTYANVCMQERIDELEKKVDHYKQLLKEIKEKYKQQSRNLQKQLANNREVYRTKITNLQESMRNVAARNRDKFDKAQREHTDALEQANATIEELRKTVREINLTVESQDHEIDTHKEYIEDIKRKLVQEQLISADMIGNNRKLHDEIKEMNSNRGKILDANTRTRIEKEKLEERLEKLDTEKVELEERILRNRKYHHERYDGVRAVNRKLIKENKKLTKHIIKLVSMIK